MQRSKKPAVSITNQAAEVFITFIRKNRLLA